MQRPSSNKMMILSLSRPCHDPDDNNSHLKLTLQKSGICDGGVGCDELSITIYEEMQQGLLFEETATQIPLAESDWR